MKMVRIIYSEDATVGSALYWRCLEGMSRASDIMTEKGYRDPENADRFWCFTCEGWATVHITGDDRAICYECLDENVFTPNEIRAHLKQQKAKEEEMEEVKAIHISDEEKQRRFDQAMRDDIDNRFTYHPPKGEQAERYVYLREQFRYVAQEVLRQCPPSRDRSLALTKLQEAMMWANASIAINE